nr:hypothetical protein [Morchella crassipes]
MAHFEKYPLLTQKGADLELFKQIVEKMNRKEHLTTEGVQEIVNLKASMNFGELSDNLLSAFPNTVAVSRPIVKDPVIYDPEWVSGFVEGEGCFFVNIYKRKDSGPPLFTPPSLHVMRGVEGGRGGGGEAALKKIKWPLPPPSPLSIVLS